MQKALEHGRAVLGRVLILGMSVQIVLGLCRIVVNLGEPTRFGMEKGVLYPFILKIIMGMAQFLHIPYYCIVYLLQLAVAFVSAYMLLHYLGRMQLWQKMLGMLTILTVPMALQCHLSVLPNSLALSMLMLELACSMRLVSKKTAITVWDAVLPHLFWILAGLTMREYMLTGAVPVVVLTIMWLMPKQRKTAGARWKYWLFGVVTAVSLCGGYILQENGPLDDCKVTWKQVFVGRMVWSSFPYTYNHLPQELRDVIDGPAVESVYRNPALLKDGFFDGFQDLDPEVADGYYGILLKQTLEVRWKALLKEVFYDMAGYMVPGVIVDMQLNGLFHYSVTGMNYWAWISGNQVIARFMMKYYLYWFAAATLLAACSLLMRRFSGEQAEAEDTSAQAAGLLCGISAVGITVWLAVYYTFTEVGMYDYKLAAWAAIMWCVFAVQAIKYDKNETNKA